MVSPLKTDNITSQTTKQSNQINPEVAGRTPGGTAADADTKGLASTGESVEVSSAGRLYSEAADKTRETNGSITGQEQASTLALLLRQQFEGDRLQALRAHGVIQPDHAAALLEGSF